MAVPKTYKDLETLLPADLLFYYRDHLDHNTYCPCICNHVTQTVEYKLDEDDYEIEIIKRMYEGYKAPSELSTQGKING